MRGESVCGDAWLHLEGANSCFLAVVDGLGHGPAAFEAATLATEHLRREVASRVRSVDLGATLQSLHHALRSTRGVVAGLATIHRPTEELAFAGIGNIEAQIIGSAAMQVLSHPGILGDGRRLHPVVHHVPFQVGWLLILHSDGLAPGPYPPVARGLPCTRIAQLLLDQLGRDDDDALVVVARLPGEV